MTPRYHPLPETLISYSSGTLPGAIAGAVACHVSLCPECTKDVRRLAAIGGLLLEGVGSATISLRAAERAVQALSAPVRSEKPNELPMDEPADPVLPQPLVRYLGMKGDEIPWKTIVKGIRNYWIDLPKGSGQMRLLRIDPGKTLLEHTHRGMELTLVLKGAYGDHTGVYFRGDIIEWDEDSSHQPRVFGDEECVCLVACEATPRYSRLMARLLRPILGF
jgi:putative transcriptional regulator